MTKEQKKWHEANINQAINRLGITRPQYFRLRKFSNQLNKLDTQNCNGEIGERDDDNGYLDSESHYDFLFREISINLEAYLYKIGKASLHKYHQGDPRGASLYLNNEPMTQSNYTSGVCIY